MKESIEFLISGVTLGLVSGISPGPLLTLVVTETLKYDCREGIKVALAPLITDVPIVLVSILFLMKLSNYDKILGIISLLGGGFILLLSYENIRTKSVQINMSNAEPHSYKKGIIANFLSPHPYLFWILVGAPMVLKGFKISVTASVLFLAGFYALFVGAKILIAVLSDMSKKVLDNKIYIYLVRILGLALVVFALVLMKDGLKFLGIVGN